MAILAAWREKIRIRTRSVHQTAYAALQPPVMVSLCEGASGQARRKNDDGAGPWRAAGVECFLPPIRAHPCPSAAPSCLFPRHGAFPSRRCSAGTGVRVFAFGILSTTKDTKSTKGGEDRTKYAVPSASNLDHTPNHAVRQLVKFLSFVFLRALRGASFAASSSLANTRRTACIQTHPVRGRLKAES